MEEFAGKVAVVTGAASGIGRALSQRLAALDMSVVMADVEGGALEEAAGALAAAGHAVLPVQTDVSQADSVSALAEQAVEAFGTVHVLCNNAGVFAAGLSWEAPQSDYDWVFGVNVWGVVHCTNAVGAQMLERGSGAIVNITSNSALEPSAGNMVANYAGTKGYVMSMSKALAYEWGPKGVRINCVSPGWIVPYEEDHVGAGSFWRKYGYEFFGTPEQMAAAAEGEGDLFNVEGQPIRRIGRPEDIADVALFLASDRAKHLTGQMISVSGGAYMP